MSNQWGPPLPAEGKEGKCRRAAGGFLAALALLGAALAGAQDTPTATLVLSPRSISENGGVSTVTATLSSASSDAVTVTVTVTASAGTGAVSRDFTQTGTTLTIAVGETTSVGVVTVTANDNAVDSLDKEVTVAGTNVPSDETLTLTDDETLPTVTLALSPSSISEGGGVTTVTAALSGESSEAVTVTVSAAPASGAAVADYVLSANKALVIAAGSTASTGTVTLTAVNNDVQASDKTVTVSGAASGGNGVSAPAGLTLTITDNDGSLPTGGGTSWTNGNLPLVDWAVTTASLLGKTASQPIAISGTYSPHIIDVWACANKTVTQSESLSNQPSSTECTKLANDIGSARSVTIVLTQAMIDNDGVVIIFTIGGGSSTQYVYAEWVPIVALPKATLSLSSSSIAENGGVTTVTATLDKVALSAATLTVSAPAGDLTLSAAATLTFATGETASTGTVTITATDNATDEPDKRVSVSAAASGDVRAPPAATLTITDDDAAPGVTLSVADSAIAEDGGTTTVSAVLSRASSAVTTVTVTPVSGAYTVGSGAAGTIVIAAGETANAADTATIAAVDNDVDAADNVVTVTGTAANGQGAGTVTGASLTITDDDDAGLDVGAVTGQATEAGGTAAFTVRLATKPSAAVTVSVTSRDASEGTVSPSSLTFTDSDWNTTQAVTVTGANDAIDDGDVTWSVRLDPSSDDANYDGLSNVDVSVTTTDDDAAPGWC